MVRVAKELEPLQPQQTDAISKLLEQVLSADGTTIHDTVRPSHQQPVVHSAPPRAPACLRWQVMRALSADAPSIRGTGLKAGVLMVRGPGSSKAVELMAVFDALLDKGDLPAHFEYGILSLYGELGRNLGSAPLEKLLNRLDGQLSSESESVAGAARGLAAALGGALDSGMVELRTQQRAQAACTAAAANTAAEAAPPPSAGPRRGRGCRAAAGVGRRSSPSSSRESRPPLRTAARRRCSPSTSSACGWASVSSRTCCRSSRRESSRCTRTRSARWSTRQPRW